MLRRHRAANNTFVRDHLLLTGTTGKVGRHEHRKNLPNKEVKEPLAAFTVAQFVRFLGISVKMPIDRTLSWAFGNIDWHREHVKGDFLRRFDLTFD